MSGTDGAGEAVGAAARLPRAGQKCRLVSGCDNIKVLDNIWARLGSEANFGSHKIKISS